MLIKVMEKIDYTVAGGGIIGLFIAKELKEKFPDKEVILMEASEFLGDEATGRNSGVLHGGMYYATGSLKHRLCIEGNQLWKNLASDFNFLINKCGKFIIACNEHEKETINKIFINGQRNKVPHLRRATEQELINLSRFTHAIDALYSPYTAILDVPSAVKRLDIYLSNLGVYILKKQSVESVSKLEDGFKINNEFITSNFINCTGLGAIAIRSQLGLFDLETRMVKGSYLKTNQKYYNESLIYPVPFKEQKGLGVHTVIDIEGNVLFGPNADIVEQLDYIIPPETIESMISDIPNRFKGVDSEKLEPAYSGIRSQVYFNGEIYKDFWLKSPEESKIEGYYECCAIDSPGLTSAPAIAKYLFRDLQKM
jgi:L-2-hydroxyglutarate oxidase LhgO